ncbi:helicase domain protein (plasmid) [Allomeiothermus silvanus DSM 9946]|uniref:Helicase domain protein n=1 Tax=Allomeiothermus silvanus (strain ATCC 700542 / DSM 9946 / NBRC 106475 / NCIMB 13440 / VI-R2) TaxID=526227 RepID=D7BJS7_ALLS1|nr:helicase-related protein [Allomeiothermus silvanus]ADH65433.1 helicase domain protein [Allomeiothermus silvanus DSM 9946]
MHFITNAREKKDLAARLADLSTASLELKFLVGFFYFSGWRELYEPLKKAAESNPNLKLKILVGLSVDRPAGRLLEVARKAEGTGQEVSWALLEEYAQALSDPSLDLEDFPEQARFFLRLLQEGRLEIRKTREPNHAKLYLFKVDAPQQRLLGSPGKFITGSSNLTHAGLRGQHEFNVEIGDYGFEEAEAYFDGLWSRAVPLRPEDIARLGEIIERGSLAALPTPFEVYALLLRRYLEVVEALPTRQGPAAYLQRIGYQALPYQLDAVELILRALQEYGGAILADVVGLGKTVVASLVAREYGGRGMVLAPPGLIGEEGRYGWLKYLADFGLHDWRAYSVGQLEEALDFLQGPGQDVELVVVDEAHRFRNPESQAYALLQAITAGRKTLLLSATPYNNYPLDVFALLRLFVTPGDSKVGPTADLEGYFRELTRAFKAYSYILRYHRARDPRKREKAERLYRDHFGDNPPVDERRVERGMAQIARKVRSAMAPVTVRRNRLDLEKDPRYREHLPAFSRLEDPKPLFYELTPDQSAFYDQVVEEWFGPEGAFRGSIYQPALYQEGLFGEEEVEDGSAEVVFALESQRNLADFMRRLLVRRFESSFGAFTRTVERLVEAHRMTLEFAQKTGYFILDRKSLEELLERMTAGEEALEIEEFMEALLQQDASAIQRGERSRERVYRLEEFRQRDLFLRHIENDLALLTQVYAQAARLQLADPQRDPKALALARFLRQSLEEEPGRKVVVFSEFVDTVEHLEQHLKGVGLRVLAVGRHLSGALMEQVVLDFDASLAEGLRRDRYDVLVTSDKLSEGVNLHRAGAVVNYDIPWNPTRVIQRVGRINRIGQRVFDALRIYHFFPTEKGSGVVDPRRVAEHKLFLIHKALGEDAKVLSPDEEPSPAQVYERLTHLPEEEESFDTWVRLEWERVQGMLPGLEERIARLPNRVKAARPGEAGALLVARKGLGFYAYAAKDASVQAVSFPEALNQARAEPATPRLDLSPEFWEVYQNLEQKLLQGDPEPFPSNSLEQKAARNLKTALEHYQKFGEEARVALIRALLRDILRYKRLPRYVLRRLIQVDLGQGGGAFRRFEGELQEIERRFAHIVLEEPRGGHAPELVVAVEWREGVAGKE